MIDPQAPASGRLPLLKQTELTETQSGLRQQLKGMLEWADLSGFPASDWKRVEVPEWRIVPEDLWERVEDQIKRVNKRFAAISVGGHGRMGRGPKYLFSGS